LVSARERTSELKEIDMMISAWWVIPIFVIGAYAGITLIAVMNVASYRIPHSDEPQRTEDSPLSVMAAALSADQETVRPNRERRSRKRSEPKRHRPDPVENQAQFQW
jgi:hypothetical protein